ncbi:MAG: PAS domain S-box protein [Candidatus Eremiobacterota bacterium]
MSLHHITDGKESEKALKLAIGYNRSLIEASIDPLVTISHDGRISDVNNATEIVTGHTREELIGTDFSDYFTEPDRARAGYQKVFRDGTVRDYELHIRHKDGHVTPVLYNASVYRDEEGHVAGVFAAARDISERKEAEKKLDHAHGKLVKQDKQAVLGQLAGAVGHELRHPLGVISNAVYFLQTTCSDKSTVTLTYLDIISGEIRKAEKIISDLLDLSHPRPAKKELTDLSILISHILKNIHIPENIKVTETIKTGLPPVYLDMIQIEQSLYNIILNACQSMPEGGNLTVITDMKEQEINISITDTGCGIPEKDIDKIFEPLFTTKARGIGLGLPVTKKLIEENGGHISVKSTEGKGSSVTIIFSGGEK